MYDRRPSGGDRVKAISGVVAVHVLVGALLISGLSIDTVGAAVERLKIFEIEQDRPPPPEPPAELRQSPTEDSAPRDEAAASNRRSSPAPTVAPTPPIPLPVEQTIKVSQVRGPDGTDPTAGAADSPGPGSGSGGSGSGLGGGGAGGSGAGFTPARRIAKIPDSAYRRIVVLSGSRRGSVGLTLKVNVDGRPSDCRIARTSGIAAVDSLMCELALAHVRFSPARDPRGRPVAQDITWYPDWSPR